MLLQTTDQVASAGLLLRKILSVKTRQIPVHPAAAEAEFAFPLPESINIYIENKVQRYWRRCRFSIWPTEMELQLLLAVPEKTWCSKCSPEIFSSIFNQPQMGVFSTANRYTVTNKKKNIEKVVLKNRKNHRENCWHDSSPVDSPRCLPQGKKSQKVMQSKNWMEGKTDWKQVHKQQRIIQF